MNALNMHIDIEPDERNGIHFTVHVPVGTDKLNDDNG